MSGGERNQRKRAQQQRGKASASKAVASARGTNSGRNRTIAAVAVVVVLAAAVIAGVLYTNSQKEAQGSQADQIRSELKIESGGVPVTKVAEQKLAPRVDGGVVEAGNPDAALTVDLYEDFLCPYCGQLFQQSNTQLEKAVDDGKIKLRYHLMGFLDQNSPSGYSSRASNAALCSVADGKFRQLYDQLYSHQPPESSPGYSNDQLVKFGQSVGVGGDFAQCVKSGKYANQVKTMTSQGQSRLGDLSSDGRIGTPSVVIAGRMVHALGVPNWLTDLIGPKKA